MSGGELLEALTPFLSRLELERIAESDGWARAPSKETFDCAVVWTDVTGFTPLVERLSDQGSGGAERLSSALSAHFGRIIDICEEYGGDLLFLAGDAALCLFRRLAGEQLSATTRRGLAAARKVLAELDGARPQADIVLRMRVTLSAGSVSAYSVGGVGGSWLLIVAGPAIAEIGAKARSAASGHLAMTERAARLVAETSAASSNAPPESHSRRVAPAISPDTPQATALLSQVLPSVTARILAGYTEFLAEFRTMSVVFADLSGLGAEWGQEQLQAVAAIVQTTANDFEATLYQFVQDDKGTVAVVVLGLPGLSHDDDPMRAVLFANTLAERLRPQIGDVSCGISTGPLFCGPCGLSRRSQYAVYGRAMNRAARLMAVADDRVVLDEATKRLASTRLELGEAQSLSVKGVDAPLVAFVGDRARTRAASLARLVGRREERSLLGRELDAFSNRGLSSIVVLEGPPGIGKTSLLAELRRVCRARGFRVAWGNADLVEARTPLFALRSILRELLGVSAGSSSADVERALRGVFESLGEDLALLPLAREAFGVDPVDTELTRQMVADIRAENRNRLLGAIVARAAQESPVVAIIDDLHWCDAATGALLPELTAVRGVLWAFATRTHESVPDILRHVSARTTRVTLGGLDESDIALVAAAALGVAEVPDALTKLLVERAAGNPLYSRELAISLADRGHVQVRNGRCHLAESFSQATTMDLPDSLAALIKSRIDKLPQSAQVTLRVASVVGQSFERRVLTDVLQTATPSFDSAALTEDLDVLEREGFLQMELAVGEPRFTFGHATAQNVAHDLILPGQLAALHHATARALERHTPRAFARLSHHWTEAREHPELSPVVSAKRVVKYSVRAAREALDGFANEDAIALYQRAILSHKLAAGEREVDLRRSSLHAWRSRAHYSLTQVSRARIDLEYAFRFAGFPAVGTGAKAVANLVVRSVRYIFSKIAGGRPTRKVGERARFRQLAALAILGEWMALDFWEARLVEAAAKAFLGYELAAGVLSSPLAAEAIARLGYVVGLTPLRFLAEAELRRAVELAERSGELQARVSARVLLGMHCTLVGRPDAAIEHLETAKDPANKLGGGLWRHRARFMLGEAMLCQGRFKEARDAFAEAAQLSIGAERPVVGLSTCMGALALARLGRLEEALALIDGPMGLPLIDPNRCLPLQRFASLGIKAEILGHLGRLSEAEEIARGEARALAESGGGYACSVFFAGLHGHAGVLNVYMQLRSRVRNSTTPSARTLFDESHRAHKLLRAFASIYPAARPRADLLAGRTHLLEGGVRRAGALLRRCLAAATAMGMPYEQALAHYWLSQTTENGANQRGDALRICREKGMAHEEHLILADDIRQETIP